MITEEQFNKAIVLRDGISQIETFLSMKGVTVDGLKPFNGGIDQLVDKFISDFKTETNGNFLLLLKAKLSELKFDYELLINDFIISSDCTAICEDCGSSNVCISEDI